MSSRRLPVRPSVLLAALLLAAATALPAAAAGYVLQVLPTLGGTAGHAAGINIKGEVVGWTTGVNGTPQPTLWRDGHARKLATGPAYALAINDKSAVIVQFGSGLSDLLRPNQPPLFMGEESFPEQINNHGTMAGSAGNGDAAIFTKTTLTRIGGLPFNYLSYASHVNDRGVVVGASLVNPGMEPTLWKGGQIYQLPVLGDFGVAVAISNHDMIVGNCWDWSTPYPGHAVRWEQMQPIALPSPSTSSAGAVNDLGEIVGWAYPAGEASPHAAHWFRDQLTDLNVFLGDDLRQAGWVLVEATGINANGWIVGEMDNTLSGESRAFLLAR